MNGMGFVELTHSVAGPFCINIEHIVTFSIAEIGGTQLDLTNGQSIYVTEQYDKIANMMLVLRK